MKYLGLPLLLAASVAGLAAQTTGAGSLPPQNAYFAGPGTHGAVLNGQPLLPGTTVMAGETVTTNPGGVAVLAPTHGSGGVLALAASASATVQTGAVSSAVGTDVLHINSGNAIASGKVTLATPQGETFAAANSSTSYVVNVSQSHASMGVLTGAVNSFGPAAAATVPAGDAVQVNTGGNGQPQLSSIKMNQVTKPSTTTTVPETITASQSGG